MAHANSKKAIYKIYDGNNWITYHFKTVASQVGTIPGADEPHGSAHSSEYLDSRQFVKGSMLEKLKKTENTARAFATLNNYGRLDEEQVPNNYSNTVNFDGGIEINQDIHLDADSEGFNIQHDGMQTSLQLTENGITSNKNFYTSASPISSADLTNKEYVDRVAGYGINIIAEVKAATTGNITLSGVQTIDGVTLVANDRVLVKNQTQGKDNGVYIVKTTAWTRADDANSSQTLSGGMTSVSGGTTNKGKIYWQSKDVNVVGADVQEWILFTSVGQFYQADGSTLELSGSTFKIKNAGVGGTQLASNAVTNAKVASNAGIELSKLAKWGPQDDISIGLNNNDRELMQGLDEIITVIKNIKGTANWHTLQDATISSLNTEVGKKQNKITVGETKPADVAGDIWIDTN